MSISDSSATINLEEEKISFHLALTYSSLLGESLFLSKISCLSIFSHL
nr:MAG TPA: hypothetical protein [Caudoviricetes sp.]